MKHIKKGVLGSTGHESIENMESVGMNDCEFCGQGFKTIQGLLGHQRMKHSISGGQGDGHLVSAAQSQNVCRYNRQFRDSVTGEQLFLVRRSDVKAAFRDVLRESFQSGLILPGSRGGAVGGLGVG